jgi:hypothetical protein
MKTLIFFTAIIYYSLILNVSGNCQLIVDAGNDTTFCDYDWQDVVLGGEPTVTGGSPPYTYTWSANYFYIFRYFTASFMLDDTTKANPVLTSPFRDTAIFYLEVRDSNDNVSSDSVSISFSCLEAELIECQEYIKLGDSIQLYHYVFGGIQPYSFYWTPEKNLSDPTSEFPWAKPSTNTKYELIVTDAVGCIHPSYCKVYIDPSAMQDNYKSSTFVSINPNPLTDFINISIESNVDLKNASIEIISIDGQVLIKKIINQHYTRIDLKNISSGVYLYRFFSQGEVFQMGKIVVK